MQKLLVIVLAATLGACGRSSGADYSSSSTTSESGSSSSAPSSTTPDTYASAQEADKALQDKQNEDAYQEMRRSGLSQADAAEAVNAVRDLCPHTDANGQCD
jgi:hypothetical protein